MTLTAHERAEITGGSSEGAIYDLVLRVLRERQPNGRDVVDVGCGQGALAARLHPLFARYTGCDLVQYPGFPVADWARFQKVDLNHAPYPVADASADAVVSIETIEHLENPRAHVRELVRIARPGGLVLLTTPNQLSLLSKFTLLTRNQFNAFQTSAGLYPAHITALVEEDLRNIAAECGLEQVEVRYSDAGRVPSTPYHWPRKLGFKGRWFSDNVLLSGTRAA